MAYTICPLCGALSHLNVSADWYEKYHPTVKRGSLVAGRCFYCWQEVNIGDPVVIRKPSESNLSIQTGERGVVEEILAELDSSAYLVYRIENGERERGLLHPRGIPKAARE